MGNISHKLFSSYVALNYSIDEPSIFTEDGLSSAVMEESDTWETSFGGFGY